MTKPKQVAPTRPGLLITEGLDDVRFFKAFLSHLQFDLTVQVENIGGKGNLNSAWLRTLKAADGFSGVRALGIIRDADEDPRSAFQSVCDALKQAGLPVPAAAGGWAQTDTLTPQVGVYILPAPDQAGALEDLCLQTVNRDPAYTCVDAYFECLQSAGLKQRSNVLAKARVQAFLASRERPGLRLGESAEKGVWDWDHPAYAALKNFLKALHNRATPGQ